jgi:hypothetical protein
MRAKLRPTVDEELKQLRRKNRELRQQLRVCHEDLRVFRKKTGLDI